MRSYLIGTGDTPDMVILDEDSLVDIVGGAVCAGATVCVAKLDDPKQRELTIEERGGQLIFHYEVEGRQRPLNRWSMWAWRVRRLLSETSERATEST